MLQWLSRSILGMAACLLFCASAQAGYIAVGATITHIMSTNGNGQSFQVQVSGGTGPCTSPTEVLIIFPLSASPDADTHKRAYAAALLALTTGMRVTIHNYTDDGCNGASYIDVYN